MVNPLEHNQLEYPYGKSWSPEFGVPYEVVDGVFWLRMPLPMQLDHINLWLLKDGDGWTIVDTGMFAPVCQEAWQQVFDNFLQPAQVVRIVVTHFHPDHMGLASWLAKKCACKVWISKPEYDYYYWIRTRDLEEYGRNASKFFKAAGVDQRTEQMYIKAFGGVSKAETLPSSSCEFIDEPQSLTIGGRAWALISGNGHSPHHLCLHCAELGVMISGDQALPRISSNISVYAENPQKNPLQDWLASCRKLQSVVPASTLVLPAHQEPFIGIVLRMQQLIDGHQDDLEKLGDSLAQPSTAMQASMALFDRELDDFGRLMALSETLAHLNYLIANGAVGLSDASQSPTLYQRLDSL